MEECEYGQKNGELYQRAVSARHPHPAQLNGGSLCAYCSRYGGRGKKKELTAEDELAAALLHLYEKHVPAAVREYIDEDDAVVPVKPKRTAKQAVPKKVEAPVEIAPAINTAPVTMDGGEESLASKYFGTT